jgi:hypothetical protein
MAFLAGIVRAGWLAAALTGLTTVLEKATYTVSGHSSHGRGRSRQERTVIMTDASLDQIAPHAAMAPEGAAQTGQTALDDDPALDVVRVPAATGRSGDTEGWLPWMGTSRAFAQGSRSAFAHGPRAWE